MCEKSVLEWTFSTYPVKFITFKMLVKITVKILIAFPVKEVINVLSSVVQLLPRKLLIQQKKGHSPRFLHQKASCDFDSALQILYWRMSPIKELSRRRERRNRSLMEKIEVEVSQKEHAAHEAQIARTQEPSAARQN